MSRKRVKPLRCTVCREVMYVETPGIRYWCSECHTVGIRTAEGVEWKHYGGNAIRNQRRRAARL